MVDTETRNNVIVIIIVIAVALMISVFIVIFANSILQVADKGQTTIDSVGKSVSGNISEATTVNKLNLNQFNKSIGDVVASNDRIIQSNNESLANLTRTVHEFSNSNIFFLSGVKNNTLTNAKTLSTLLNATKEANSLLENISNKLTLVPIVPVPNPQNSTCNIYSKDFPWCVLPPGHPIFDLLNKTHPHT